MRIFIGIDLAAEIRSRIERFMEGIEGFAPEARWTRPESLHLTLKFVGEQTPEQVETLRERLLSTEGGALEIRCAGYGFFPTKKAARVFWIGIQSGPQLAELAGTIDETTSGVGIPKEERPFSPHLTLARAGGRSASPKRLRGDGPHSVFAELNRRLEPMKQLDFGTMTVREFILYQSQLSASGSKYTSLERFPLKPIA